MSAKCAKALELIADAAGLLVEHAKHPALADRSGPEEKDAAAAIKAAAKALAAAGHIFGDGGQYGVAPPCVEDLERKVAKALE